MEINLMNLGTGEGAWLPLPVNDETEINDFIQEHRISTPIDEEYIIADFNFDDELNLRIGEFEDIYLLNELINQYENLSKYGKNTVLALLETHGNEISDFENALSTYEDFTLIENIDNDYDLGEYLAEDELCCLRKQVSSRLLDYIDYKSYGHDAIYNGDVILTSYGALF